MAAGKMRVALQNRLLLKNSLFPSRLLRERLGTVQGLGLAVATVAVGLMSLG